MTIKKYLKKKINFVTMNNIKNINFFIFFIFCFLVYILKDVISPFFISLFISYLINPFVSLVEKLFKIKQRSISVSISIIFLLSLTFGLLLFSIPLIYNEIQLGSVLIKKHIQSVTIIPESFQVKILSIFNNFNFKNIDIDTLNSIYSQISPILINFFSSSISFFIGIFGIFLIFLYTVLILMSSPTIEKITNDYVSNKYKPIFKEIFYDLNLGMKSYFRGQALIAFIVGIMFCIGFKIIDLPLAIVFGLFIGILNLVPYLQLIAIFPAFFLSIISSLENNENIFFSISITLLIFVIVQIVQELILIPKIMNKVTGLNPAIIILSLSIWGKLLGITGFIIALPLTTLFISYYKRFINN